MRNLLMDFGLDFTIHAVVVASLSALFWVLGRCFGARFSRRSALVGVAVLALASLVEIQRVRLTDSAGRLFSEKLRLGLQGVNPLAGLVAQEGWVEGTAESITCFGLISTGRHSSSHLIECSGFTYALEPKR